MANAMSHGETPSAPKFNADAASKIDVKATMAKTFPRVHRQSSNRSKSSGIVVIVGMGFYLWVMELMRRLS
jgi:hypothetical protein